MSTLPMPTGMKPGSRSVAGSGLADGAHGKDEIPGVAEVMPAGVQMYPTGSGQVSFAQGASPPAVGGAQREKRQVKSGPMPKG